jgi:hypothetical protein
MFGFFFFLIAVLKVKTCLQPILLVGLRLGTLDWQDKIHAKKSGLHPVVTDLRDLTLFQNLLRFFKLLLVDTGI